jgi:hypothetical protein
MLPFILLNSLCTLGQTAGCFRSSDPMFDILWKMMSIYNSEEGQTIQWTNES